MKTLHPHPIGEIDHLIQPNHFDDINLTSAAREILVDFHHSPPSIIDADTQVVSALEMMLHEHCQIKMVIDINQELIGIITQDALSPQAITIHQNKFTPKREITVEDLMIPREQLLALDYEQVLAANVGDILNTLKQSGVHHCLVVDASNHQIRGLLNSADIAARLHIAPPTAEEKTSFFSIFKHLSQRLAQLKQTHQTL